MTAPAACRVTSAVSNAPTTWRGGKFLNAGIEPAIAATSFACRLSTSVPLLRAAMYDTKIPATVSELR